jgi:ribosomal-protein-alanine N-acetyltransferase
MTEAVRALTAYSFETLRLHRVEAAVQPVNEPSMRVLERVGFAREGLARRYLKINGVWQDHYLYAALDDDWLNAEARRS